MWDKRDSRCDWACVHLRHCVRGFGHTLRAERTHVDSGSASCSTADTGRRSRELDRHLCGAA